MAYKVKWFIEDGDLKGIYHIAGKADEDNDTYRTLQDAKRVVIAAFNQDIEGLKQKMAEIKKLRVSDVEWEDTNFDDRYWIDPVTLERSYDPLPHTNLRL